MKKVLLFASSRALDQTIPQGSKLRVSIDGKSICLVRTKDSLKAFIDSCPHLGESLYSGHLNYSNEIICPWHAYRFSLSTGEEIESRCNSLKFIEVSFEGDETYLILANS